jgi:hypothetical protein
MQFLCAPVLGEHCPDFAWLRRLCPASLATWFTIDYAIMARPHTLSCGDRIVPPSAKPPRPARLEALRGYALAEAAHENTDTKANGIESR